MTDLGWMQGPINKDILAELKKPFDQDVVSWKPGATSRDKTSALALAFADPRAYIDRLNDVVEGEWGDRYETLVIQDPADNHNDRLLVSCYLTIYGVTRSDVGECLLITSRWDSRENKQVDIPEENAYTSAVAQAFKRACTKFGIGEYLYQLPREWVEYDSEKRWFSERGQQQLSRILDNVTKGPMAPGFAALLTTSKGTALGDCTPDMLDLVARESNNPELKEGAKVLLDFISDKVGATDPDATYNKLKG